MPPAPPRRPAGRFPKLGTRIVVFFVALLVIVQGVAAFLVIQANSQVARRTINQQLEQGERVFRQLLTQNQARLEQGAGILSADFAFRQAIASNDTGILNGKHIGLNYIPPSKCGSLHIYCDTMILRIGRAKLAYVWNGAMLLDYCSAHAVSPYLQNLLENPMRA